MRRTAFAVGWFVAGVGLAQAQTVPADATTPTGPVRVTFSPDPAALTIVVERPRDGKAVSTDFNYKRIAR